MEKIKVQSVGKTRNPYPRYALTCPAGFLTRPTPSAHGKVENVNRYAVLSPDQYDSFATDDGIDFEAEQTQNNPSMSPLREKKRETFPEMGPKEKGIG